MQETAEKQNPVKVSLRSDSLPFKGYSCGPQVIKHIFYSQFPHIWSSCHSYETSLLMGQDGFGGGVTLSSWLE